MNAPIFIGWTRSFWLGIVPIFVVILDLIVSLTAPGTIGPVSTFIASLTKLTPDQVASIMKGVGTIAGLIIAHQRRGSSRPYTLKVNSETLR